MSSERGHFLIFSFAPISSEEAQELIVRSENEDISKVRPSSKTYFVESSLDPEAKSILLRSLSEKEAAAYRLSRLRLDDSSDFEDFSVECVFDFQSKTLVFQASEYTKIIEFETSNFHRRPLYLLYDPISDLAFVIFIDGTIMKLSNVENELEDVFRVKLRKKTSTTPNPLKFIEVFSPNCFRYGPLAICYDHEKNEIFPFFDENGISLKERVLSATKDFFNLKNMIDPSDVITATDLDMTFFLFLFRKPIDLEPAETRKETSKLFAIALSKHALIKDGFKVSENNLSFLVTSEIEQSLSLSAVFSRQGQILINYSSDEKEKTFAINSDVIKSHFLIDQKEIKKLFLKNSAILHIYSPTAYPFRLLSVIDRKRVLLETRTIQKVNKDVFFRPRFERVKIVSSYNKPLKLKVDTKKLFSNRKFQYQINSDHVEMISDQERKTSSAKDFEFEFLSFQRPHVYRLENEIEISRSFLKEIFSIDRVVDYEIDFDQTLTLYRQTNLLDPSALEKIVLDQKALDALEKKKKTYPPLERDLKKRESTRIQKTLRRLRF